jgi:hypothetical protein
MTADECEAAFGKHVATRMRRDATRASTAAAAAASAVTADERK